KGPSDAEVEKARRQVQSRMIRGVERNIGRAIRLGEFEAFFGDARLFNAELPRYLAVTKEDIKRVAAQYLGPTRRSIVETYPAAAEANPAEKPGAKASVVGASSTTGSPEAKKPSKAAAAPVEPKAKKGGGAAAPAAKTTKKPKK